LPEEKGRQRREGKGRQTERGEGHQVQLSWRERAARGKRESETSMIGQQIAWRMLKQIQGEAVRKELADTLECMSWCKQ